MTAVAPARLPPVIVTDVPPAIGPIAGAIPLTAGAAVGVEEETAVTATYVNWSADDVAEVPPGVVTVMSSVAAPALAGAAAVIELAESTVTELAGVDPNATAEPLVKPVPVIVTLVPPAVGPLDGLTSVTVGAESYVYWSAGVAEDVNWLFVEPLTMLSVTMTSTVPGVAFAGTAAVIEVLETTSTRGAGFEFDGPKLTVAPLPKLVPVIVTVEPPPSCPTFGVTDVTVGTFVYVKWSTAEVADVPPGVVTVMSTVLALAAGLMAVIEAGELTLIAGAGVVPNATVEPLVKPVPLIVTLAPPASGPAAKLMPVTVGTGS
jgi:hypothetical protein